MARARRRVHRGASRRGQGGSAEQGALRQRAHQFDGRGGDGQRRGSPSSCRRAPVRPRSSGPRSHSKGTPARAATSPSARMERCWRRPRRTGRSGCGSFARASTRVRCLAGERWSPSPSRPVAPPTSPRRRPKARSRSLGFLDDSAGQANFFSIFNACFELINTSPLEVYQVVGVFIF